MRDRFPKPGTSGDRLLELVAVCGEFPAGLTARIPGSMSYMETILTSLKREGFLKLYYKDGLRGFRLGRRAKTVLMFRHPERFSFYLTGNTDTNRIRGEVPRRLRLHRTAETFVAMLNAGVKMFRDEKPAVFAPEGPLVPFLDVAAFYGSREIKEMGIEAVKIRSSRMMGVLLAPSGIFITYNGGPYMVKWDYQAEVRTQVFLRTELCCRRLPDQYGKSEVSGLLFGDGMEAFSRILEGKDSGLRCFFLLDGNYEHFYYLTNDRHGEVLLRLLCDVGRRQELDSILMQGLAGRDGGLTVENDSVDEKGNPVLFGYFLDIPRISRFCTALQLQDRQGTMVCFDFQEDALRRFCGKQVALSTISFEKFERRFFP